MASHNIITAYSVAVPEKQTQELPGLDRYIMAGIESAGTTTANTTFENVHGKRKGKYALITGGDSGIGRATTTMFTIGGLRGVTISHLPQETEGAADNVTMYGCDVNMIAPDLQRDADCERLVASHIDKFGRVNMLVNNASNIEEKIEHMDLDNVRSTFEYNIIQMIAVTKFAIPHMKRGWSINTTSFVAYAGSPGLGAIVSFTRSLAKQLAPKGIRVNAIAPGPVVTALQPASRDTEDIETFGVGSPLHGRATQPAELAPTFIFLASPDSNVMTGASIHVNNGMHVGGS